MRIKTQNELFRVVPSLVQQMMFMYAHAACMFTDLMGPSLLDKNNQRDLCGEMPQTARAQTGYEWIWRTLS